MQISRFFNPNFVSLCAVATLFIVVNRALGQPRDIVSLSNEFAPAQLQTNECRSSFDQLQASVYSLSFYESGSKKVLPDEERELKQDFKSKDARYIWWQLALTYPKATEDIDFRLHAIYYNWDNAIVFEQYADVSVKENWTSSHYTKGYGWPDSGHWEKGDYRVDIYNGKRKLASNSFRID